MFKKDKSLLVGGFFASILASICCVGPIVFAVLGISSAGLLSSVELLRPLFVMIALSSLAVAFYLTYSEKFSPQCEPGTHCPTPTSRKQKQYFLWFSAFLIISSITFPYWSALGLKNIKFEGEGKFIEKNFYIKGMTCSGCIISVEKALLKEKSRIKSFNVRVGKMEIRFDAKTYQNKKTDCLVEKLVQGETPYHVYLDNTFETRACE